MLENLELLKGSKELITQNLNQLTEIDRTFFNDLASYSESFLYDLKDKFELSQLVFKDSNLIGYAILSRKETTIHIHKFVIKSEFSSKGYGKMLMVKLQETLINEKLTLKVEKSNLNAIIFYLKKKFIFTMSMNEYYVMEYGQ